MRPLICFSDQEHFMFSDNYLRIDCSENQNLIDFLRDIEKTYFSEMKVVQICFESSPCSQSQITLYPARKASIFILHSFELKSLNEILNSHPEVLEEITFNPLTEKSEFIEKTQFVIDQIKNGRIYQANLTAPLKGKTNQNSFSLFKKYQKSFNGRYKALLPLEHVDVLCFSPELFLEQKNGVLITRPIKGSVPQEQNFENDLIKNEKENAELSMIVDLLRNDLNSLSNESSSEVVLHRAPMSLGYIQHTFSEIQIQNRLPLSAVIEKTFPGGSISGCPKIESLIVISEAEKYRRQIYTGSLGWWKENDFCLNIAIRTMILHQTDLYYHAGCGIVFDSAPDSEWEEFILKTGVLHVRH